MSAAIHEWVGAYVFGVLEHDETDAFERHLDECADCRAELASLSPVIEAFGDDAATDPPEGLHARVTGAIAGIEQAPPTLAAARGRREARRSRLFGPGTLAIAAAFVLVLAVAVTALWPDGLTADQRQLAAVLDAPDAREIALGVGDVKLVVSDEAGGYAALGNVPALEAGLAYQMWLVTDQGEVNPGPTFTPGEDGTFEMSQLIDLSGVVAFAVSVEPAAGSLAPTTDPIALAEL